MSFYKSAYRLQKGRFDLDASLFFFFLIIGAVIVLGRSVLNFKKTIRDKPPVFVETEIARGSFDGRTAKHLSPAAILRGAAYVVDGDTLTIQKTQVRLFGIDAPEMNHPYGKNAKWALVNLCKGQVINAEITETDSHGRTVAKCTLPDGRDLSAEMVKLGLAIDWPKFSGGLYSSLEEPAVRKKLWLADARQKGRIDVWERFELQQRARQMKD